MAGLIAVVGLAPKLVVKRAAAAPATSAPAAPFQLRPEPRAVARAAASV